VLAARSPTCTPPLGLIHGSVALSPHPLSLDHFNTQIVPEILAKMSADPDRAKAKRVTDAMLKMVKIDIAKLRAAYDGAKV
jgi:hypothetical protein